MVCAPECQNDRAAGVPGGPDAIGAFADQPVRSQGQFARLRIRPNMIPLNGQRGPSRRERF